MKCSLDLILAAASSVLAMVILQGCATPPSLNTSAVNTPVAHPENKVLFLQFLTTNERTEFNQEVTGYRGLTKAYYEDRFEPNAEAQQANLPGDSRQFVPLKYGYEISAIDDNIIKKGHPITIILNGIWLPPFQSKKDIAVILDIATKEGENQPVVAFYQRDVPGGMMLNFKNLTVYTNESWDGKTQPYFRLRILDAKAERNNNSQAMLESASELSGSISGIIPSTSLPQVALAIDIARFVLGNRKNEILLDYTIQFYGSGKPDRVGGNLDEFAEGNWLVVGRPRNSTSEFWDAAFYMDRKENVIRRRSLALESEIDQFFLNGEFLAEYERSLEGQPELPVEDSGSKELRDGFPANPYALGTRFRDLTEALYNVPYLSTIVIKEDYSVPDYVTEAQGELTKLITNGEARTKTEDLVGLFKRGMEVSSAQELVESFKANKSVSVLQVLINKVNPEHEDFVEDGFVVRQIKDILKDTLEIDFIALSSASASPGGAVVGLDFLKNIGSTGSFVVVGQSVEWRWKDSARGALGLAESSGQTP